jgi:hypothetical protein
VRRVAVTLIAAAGVIAAALALTGGDDGARERDRAARPGATATATATPERTRRRTPHARCPAGAPGCVAVHGRIVYVEAVDPDGDGDLHVVLLAGSVTLPDLTSVDVAKELRPRRDPRIGDLAAAAGPVQTGHIGQSQIHALVFQTSR